MSQIGNYDNNQADSFIDFLISNHIVEPANTDYNKNSRYDRQISYFDDMILCRPGTETQDIIESKKIVMIGCGSVGSLLADILVRSGIQEITLIDYKKITKNCLDTHLIASIDNIGEYKVNALANNLISVNHNLKCRCVIEMLLPETDLSKWIDEDTDIVINGCDEPYIGHTSLKIGRYLNNKPIPMYVLGGFDAHLMSSGELIIPPQTPCIDCAQKTFSNALGDWKPTYSTTQTGVDTAKSSDQSYYVAGGPGKLSMISGFSANIAALNILQYLAGDPNYSFSLTRYEYLMNSGSMTEFTMQKQDGCSVCNK